MNIPPTMPNILQLQPTELPYRYLKGILCHQLSKKGSPGMVQARNTGRSPRKGTIVERQLGGILKRTPNQHRTSKSNRDSGDGTTALIHARQCQTLRLLSMLQHSCIQ